MLLKSAILSSVEGVWKDYIDGFLLVFNPASEKGVVILNKEAAFLFNQIDGRKTVWQIFLEAKRADPEVKISEISKILKNFLSLEIVGFGNLTPKTKIASKKPKVLGVWLHLTNFCNLRCPYCYVWKSKEKMSEKTAKKSIKKVFFAAQKHRFQKIKFKLAGGEPLLEFPFVLKLVDFGKRLSLKTKIKAEFVVLTNGVLLTEETAEKLKKKEIRVAVSLDGLGKYHDSLRVFPNGSGSFKFVEKGIKNLQKFKVPFNVTVTITSKNIENVPDLTKYLLDRQIPFAFNFYRESPFSKEEVKVEPKKMVKYLKTAYQIISRNLPPYCLIDGLLDRVSFSPHLFPCGSGRNYLVIHHNGKIAFCQTVFEKPLGSIEDKKDLIEMMSQSASFGFKNLSVEKKNPCKRCRWRYLCCGGCPLLTFKRKGKYETSSPYCSVYKKLIPEVLKLEARRLIKYGNVC